MTKVSNVTCRSCGLVADGDEFPQGWYFLSVVDRMAPTGKGYRYLGLFCSIVCLAGHMPQMHAVEEQMRKRVRS